MTTGAQHLLTDDQFEDALDERGILRNGKAMRIARDGEAFRVSMMVMDGRRYEDAADNHSFDVERNTSEREQVYADAEQRLTNAWRDPASTFNEEDEPLRPDEIITPWRGRFSAAAPLPTNDAQREPETLADAYAAAETRLTTAYLDPYAAYRDPSPAVASQQPTNDDQKPPATLEDSYALYHDRLVNSWRNPPAMAPIIPDSNPQSLLPPPSATMSDERAATYQAYNERISRQWENPL